MWTIAVDRRRRQEHVGFQFDVYTPTRQFRLADELTFRTYTLGQMRALFRRIPGLEVIETYDFGYKIREPIHVDADGRRGLRVAEEIVALPDGSG